MVTIVLEGGGPKEETLRASLRSARMKVSAYGIVYAEDRQERALNYQLRWKPESQTRKHQLFLKRWLICPASKALPGSLNSSSLVQQ